VDEKEEEEEERNKKAYKEIAIKLIRFHYYLPGNIIVEYTPANGANGALISFDGDFLLLGNGYKKNIIFHYEIKSQIR
jgi:hypothetical protein